VGGKDGGYDSPVTKDLKYVVPTALTAGNLLCGSALLFMLFARSGTPTSLVLLLCAAVVFDALDGWAARRLDAVSRAGAWCDAVADGVTFALVPACLVLQVSTHAFALDLLAVVIFLVAGWWRLQRFAMASRPGQDQGQDQSGPTTLFRGLPVPAAGVVLVASALLMGEAAWVVAVVLAVLMHCPARVPHPVRVLWG